MQKPQDLTDQEWMLLKCFTGTQSFIIWSQPLVSSSVQQVKPVNSTGVLLSSLVTKGYLKMHDSIVTDQVNQQNRFLLENKGKQLIF